MMSDQLSMDYKYGIVNLWMDAIGKGILFRISHIESEGKVNGKVWNEYLAILTRIWVELRPGVVGMGSKSAEYKIAEDTFIKFRPMIFEPTQFAQNPDKVYELEEVIREIIDKLNITKFD